MLRTPDTTLSVASQGTDRSTGERGGGVAPKACYLGTVVHIYNIDWPVGITHKKYGIFIRLKDIQ